MEPVLFFYSTDGTNAFGPVTEDALRRLLKDQIIGPASFVCPAGETEWKPLDVDYLRRPPSQTTRLQPYEPPPYVPTVHAKRREEARVQHLAEVYDEGPFPTLFKWGCGVFAAAVTVALAVMPGNFQVAMAGVFTGLLFTALLPHLISLAFKRSWRLRVCAIAMVIFAALSLIGQERLAKRVRLMTSLKEMDEGVENDARQQIAKKGYYDGNVPQAEANLEKMKEETADDTSETGRMVHASLAVGQEMLDKVKASEEAEKACGSFDPALLTDLVSLHTLQEEITKLRATQADVLAYVQTYDDRVRAALAEGNFSAEGIQQFTAGAHKAGHFDQEVALWQLRIKLTDDHLARLDFLDKHWGSWQAKDGKLLFANQDDLDAYNALTKSLVLDIQQGRDLQNQVFAK